MTPFSFLRLDPVIWRQALHTERGAVFKVTCRVSDKGLVISDAGDAGGMHTELTFVRGAYDWKIPEGPPGSLGFLGYHPADQYSDIAFMAGGCAIKEDMFDDAWHRIKTSNYDSCTITLEVTPIDFEGDHPLWDRSKSKFLYIQEMELMFLHKEKLKEAAPQPKRGLFG